MALTRQPLTLCFWTSAVPQGPMGAGGLVKPAHVELDCVTLLWEKQKNGDLLCSVGLRGPFGPDRQETASNLDPRSQYLSSFF